MNRYFFPQHSSFSSTTTGFLLFSPLPNVNSILFALYSIWILIFSLNTSPSLSPPTMNHSLLPTEYESSSFLPVPTGILPFSPHQHVPLFFPGILTFPYNMSPSLLSPTQHESFSYPTTWILFFHLNRIPSLFSTTRRESFNFPTTWLLLSHLNSFSLLYLIQQKSFPSLSPTSFSSPYESFPFLTTWVLPSLPHPTWMLPFTPTMRGNG